jgi:hypothetical protein
MSKSSKHIYACGCSYTQKNWFKTQSDKKIGGWPMWPEILGKHLNLPVVNLAKGGMGNDYILAMSMRYILENYKNIELVAIAWSQSSRYMLYDKHHFNPSVWLEGDPQDWNTETGNPGYRHYENPYSYSQFLMNHINSRGELNTLASRYVRHVYTLQKLCEVLNVKYVFAGALRPLQLYEWRQLDNFNEKKELQSFTKVDNFYDINIANTIGWPFQEELGGKTLTSSDDFFPYGKNRVNNDSHPDENGQRIIAQQYIDHYEKR